MATRIQSHDTLPDGATSRSVPSEETLTRLWARDADGVVCLTQTDLPTALQGTPIEVCKRRGYRPILSTLGASEWPDFYDWACRTHEKVWRYWITTPDALLEGVRRFVAAAESGGLPSDWVEKAAEDAEGTPHTLCSFTMTMDQARALGAEQEALMALGSLPGDVHFFQVVASIEGFGGVEKESRQPSQVDQALYEPGHLFQTSHPDAAGERGAQWSEQDVLDTTGLTLT